MTVDLHRHPTDTDGADLEKALRRLSSIEADRNLILSVYLVLDPVHNDWKSIRPRLKNLLRPIEEVAASGELGHQRSTALRDAVEDALAMSSDLERQVSRGVALFLAPDIGLSEKIDLPVRVWDCAVAGPTPYLRPLLAVVDEFHRTVAVTLDARRAEITTFSFGRMYDTQVVEAEELRKTNLAGWYGLDELRNRQHGEEVRRRLFREVADILDRMNRERKVELVLLGGQHEVTQSLLPFLEPGVRAMTETFVVDIHTLTPEILAARVAELHRAYEAREEAREVDEIYSSAAESGLGILGIDPVLGAASIHAVARLLIHDGAMVPGSVCARCGALSRRDGTCAVCGGEMRKVADILEELARAVVEAGGSVEHVMTPTPLASDIVAARLRFIS